VTTKNNNYNTSRYKLQPVKESHDITVIAIGAFVTLDIHLTSHNKLKGS
jgi:hypothetical protein